MKKTLWTSEEIYVDLLASSNVCDLPMYLNVPRRNNKMSLALTPKALVDVHLSNTSCYFMSLHTETNSL